MKDSQTQGQGQSQTQNIKCIYNGQSFNITINKNESLLNLKQMIVNQMKAIKVFTYATNIGIRYGFPPKLITDNKSDSKTLPELSIINNECLRIELLDPKCLKASDTEIIDYSKFKVKKKPIPADNSCLFNAINFAINQSTTEPEVVRSIISMVIMDNPNDYNSAILDRDPFEYCEWILKGDSWGGGIELSILAKYFNIKIGVVDIKNITIEYFGEEFNEVIYLLYDNVHYDVFYVEKGEGKTSGVFKANDEEIKKEVIEICKELQLHQKYVNTENYSIKCMECNFLMKGNEDVIEHSKKTGHGNYSQV